MIESLHRPTVIDISLDNIVYNLKQVMAALPSQTKAWGVIKANAYGHGAVAVARALEPEVAGFCLSNLDEALELRRAGIDKPLLVMGVIPIGSVALAMSENIHLTVTSKEWLDSLLLSEIDCSALVFHIKVDSGMGRLGFRSSEAINQAVAALSAKGAQFAGIFTHFATADDPDQTLFDRQLLFFKEILKSLPSQPEWVHASNSAASIWHQDTVFTAVRLGNILYGLNPSGRTLELPYAIRPALSLSSSLVQVKEVPKGTSIGYGGDYVTDSSQWIGTVPIGYADGLGRGMQGFQVLVDGQFCEIVGRVSMDQITIRLDKSYPLGTTVTLIGDSGKEHLSVQDWADQLGTINYEVVCLLSDRVPRQYDQS